MYKLVLFTKRHNTYIIVNDGLIVTFMGIEFWEKTKTYTTIVINCGESSFAKRNRKVFNESFL